MKIVLIILLIAFTSFIACNRDISQEKIIDNKSTLILIVKDNNYKIIHELKILPYSPKYIELNKWINKNTQGWNNDYNSYVSKITLRSDKYSLMIFESGVVLSFIDNNGKSIQLSKKIEKDELKFLFETTTNANDSFFNKYINSIPHYKLPLNFKCGLNNIINKDSFYLFLNFIPNNIDGIYGYLVNDRNFKLILYGNVGDDIYPYLYSYNDQGKIIDHLNLINNRCGGADESVIPSSSILIDDRLDIYLTDSILYIHYLSNTNYKIDSIKVTQTLIKLDDKGRFIKEKIK